MKQKIFTLLLIVVINSTSAFTQAVSVQDSSALVDLYNNTNGPHWAVHTNWLTGSVRTWYGITVSGTRVTGINLSYDDLNGSIPSSLANLTNLSYLYLSHNYLSGSIPSSLGNLVNLQYLDLFYNYLSGGIPSSLGNLANLQSLNLGSNPYLNGSIPSSLGNLAKLQYLSLGKSIERQHSSFSW